MLLETRDKLDSKIGVENVFKHDSNEESKETMNAALYGEPMFHNGRQFKEDGLNDGEVYVDLGDDPMKEVVKKLDERIKNAFANDMSEKETARVK